MSTESLRLREQVVRTALERLHAPTMPDWENADRDFEQAIAAFARLRERDFALTQVLTRGLHAALVQGKRASVRLDWTVKAMKDALALLKETP